MTITTPQPAQQAAEQAISIRPAGQVMRLSRLGSFFPHRLSFMRILMRRLCAERPELRISSQSLDKDGYGHNVCYDHTLITFEHYQPSGCPGCGKLEPSHKYLPR